MELYGRKISFRRSIWAEQQLKKAAPDGNILAFFEKMKDPDPIETMNTMITFCLVLANADEKYQAFRAHQTGEKYEAFEWTRDFFENMTESELGDAVTEAMHSWNGDAKQEVEATPTGKNAKRQSKAKS